MLKRETLEAAVISAAKLQGYDLNGQDKLVLRTRVSACLAAKERHRQRMSAGEFEWKRPKPSRT